MTQSPELRQPNPEEGPPAPETLVDISNQLYELTTYLPTPEVSYDRSLTLSPEAQGSAPSVPEPITLETTEKLNSRHTRIFAVDMPRTEEPGEPEHGSIIFTRNGRVGRTELLAVPQSEGTPPFSEALHALEARQHEHRVLADIATIMRRMTLTNSRHTIYGVTLDDREFSRLWDTIAASLDDMQVPTMYRYSHVAEIGEKSALVAVTDYIPGQRLQPETGSPVHWQVDVSGDFSFDYEATGGEVTARFIDQAAIRRVRDSLPPLTQQDRLSHPYFVLRTPEAEIASGCGPYKVIKAVIDPDDFEGNFEDTQEFEPHTEYAKSPQEARGIADEWYQEDKAHEMVGRELTEVRTQRVAAALAEITARTRNEALEK